MPTIFLNFPLPPTINSYYQFHGHRRFVGEAGKKFKAQVAHIVSSQPIRFGNQKLAMLVVVHFRDRRKQDLSNRIKALEDAMVQAGLFDDDSQIKEIHIKEGAIEKGGRVSVTLKDI
jgi:crossover junction endodeoxyribonuclease RusA